MSGQTHNVLGFSRMIKFPDFAVEGSFLLLDKSFDLDLQADVIFLDECDRSFDVLLSLRFILVFLLVLSISATETPRSIIYIPKSIQFISKIKKVAIAFNGFLIFKIGKNLKTFDTSFSVRHHDQILFKFRNILFPFRVSRKSSFERHSVVICWKGCNK